MIRNLYAIGNGWAVSMSMSLIKLLGIDPINSYFIFQISNQQLEIREIVGEELSNSKNNLIRKFTKNGKGFALYLPNSVLELLEIDPEIDKIKIAVEKNIMIIKKHIIAG
ncbi:MAG: hypothetical protein R3Y28_06805 [Candidatus Gastranaerophilales bacterium]